VRWRWIVVVVVIVALLVGGAVVATNVLLSRAEDEVASSLEQTFALDESPDVQIVEERPFLLQVLRGSLDEVHASAARLDLDQVSLVDVTATATDVTTAAPRTAGALKAGGTVPLDQLQQIVADQSGLDVTLAVEGDALRASTSVFTLELGITLAPRADSGRLLVDVVSVDVAGASVAIDALPGQVRDALTGFEVPLDGLPAALALDDAHVTADGVEVTVTGTAVPLVATGVAEN
jgi:hypothetical protein